LLTRSDQGEIGSHRLPVPVGILISTTLPLSFFHKTLEFFGARFAVVITAKQ